MRIGRIAQLPKQVFEKIAAGEVVTGPLSVIKELTENAIDAGASSLTAEIREGGKSYIRVTDDGAGIRREDVETAFLPHATSKISVEADLDDIKTLGFRGEALASIAAVSRVEMVTKTPDAKVASAIFAEGGRIGSVQDTGAADGTTVIVRDLYFNTPARLKFMKSDRAESAAIIDFISKIAVAYPRIRVKMINNGAILFSTNGQGDVLRAALTVYGADGGEGLIPVEGQTAHMSVKAWISGSNKSKRSRRGQILFVNGRCVTDGTVTRAIAEAYREYLFEGRFPIVYLFLRIDPSLIDVNVHPAKSEIRFHESQAVGTFIRDTLRSALASKGGIPGIPADRTSKRTLWEQRRKEAMFYTLKDGGGDGIGDGKSVSEEGKTAGATAHTPPAADRKPCTDADDADQPVKLINIKTLWSSSLADIQTNDDYDAADPHPDDGRKAAGAQPDRMPIVQSEMDIAHLRVFGSVFATYLLAADDDSFYIIDQHAAHERVNYERFLAQRRDADKLIQQLLTPLVCRLPAAAKAAVDDWAQWLSDLGFEAALFGENALIVKTFPAFLPYAEAEVFLRDIIDNAADAPPDNGKALERLISRACRQAVKGNDVLKDDEISRLLGDLARCGNPFTCPHGRPVFIRMSRRDLEKLFKRA
ncbi:MAG: DNA mismatch repair endonuclease MutL [Clostridiales Family XIII bacterium]|jgi:DNA mismatch repair protein MutL|nr:DNA mismatch repair endonuclease MutL [Clostridiales Family XIII bacterium]